jgi:hypothetical protein
VLSCDARSQPTCLWDSVSVQQRAHTQHYALCDTLRTVTVDAYTNTLPQFLCAYLACPNNNNNNKQKQYCMAGDAPTAALAPHMTTFLQLLKDEDLDVRRSALLLANAAVHHQPALVAELLPTQITPVLLETVSSVYPL